MWNADLGRERLSKSPMRPPRIDASWTKARSFRSSYRVAIRRLCLILLKRSTRLRGFIEVGTEAIGLLRLLFGEMPCSLVDDEFSDPVGVIAMIGKQHRSTYRYYKSKDALCSMLEFTCYNWTSPTSDFLNAQDITEGSAIETLIQVAVHSIAWGNKD